MISPKHSECSEESTTLLHNCWRKVATGGFIRAVFLPRFLSTFFEPTRLHARKKIPYSFSGPSIVPVPNFVENSQPVYEMKSLVKYKYTRLLAAPSALQQSCFVRRFAAHFRKMMFAASPLTIPEKVTVFFFNPWTPHVVLLLLKWFSKKKIKQVE